MYCIICGRPLHTQARQGTICQCCAHARREKRALAGEMIHVNYCYACGGLYNPQDASIRHLYCVEGDAMHLSFLKPARRE